jgi:hypothetical protein
MSPLWFPRASTLRASGVSTVSASNLPEENRQVTDLSPRVPSDGWSRFTSGLRVFGSPGLSNVKPENHPEENPQSE